MKSSLAFTKLIHHLLGFEVDFFLQRGSHVKAILVLNLNHNRVLDGFALKSTLIIVDCVWNACGTYMKIIISVSISIIKLSHVFTSTLSMFLSHVDHMWRLFLNSFSECSISTNNSID